MSNIKFNSESVYRKVMLTYSKYSHICLSTWKQFTPLLDYTWTFLDPIVHLSEASMPMLAFGKFLSNFVLTTLSCMSVSLDWPNMAFSLHLKLEMECSIFLMRDA